MSTIVPTPILSVLGDCFTCIVFTLSPLMFKTLILTSCVNKVKLGSNWREVLDKSSWILNAPLKQRVATDQSRRMFSLLSFPFLISSLRSFMTGIVMVCLVGFLAVLFLI